MRKIPTGCLMPCVSFDSIWFRMWWAQVSSGTEGVVFSYMIHVIISDCNMVCWTSLQTLNQQKSSRHIYISYSKDPHELSCHRPPHFRLKSAQIVSCSNAEFREHYTILIDAVVYIFQNIFNTWSVFLIIVWCQHFSTLLISADIPHIFLFLV